MAEPRRDPSRPEPAGEVTETLRLQLNLSVAVLGEMGEGIADLQHVVVPFQFFDQPVRLLRQEADAVQSGIGLQ